MKMLCFFLIVTLALPSFGMAVQAADGAEPQELNLMCVGDSLTFGAATANPLRESYPAQLKKMKGSLKLKVINYGCSGVTASSGTNMPYVGTEQYAKSMRKAPDAVLVMLGTNDGVKWRPESFERDFAALIAGYQSLDSKPVVFVILPPVRYDDQAAEQVLRDKIRPIERVVAERMGCPVLDACAWTQGQDVLYSDGLHFTKEGYGMLAANIYSELELYYNLMQEGETDGEQASACCY